MSALIVDASVGLKWFVAEVHSAEALLWRNSTPDLHTLAVFFDIEVANILWKKVERAELLLADATLILSKLNALPLTRHAEASVLQAAFSVAAQLHRTVYDCLYLALAIQLGGRMLTADQRLFNSVSASALASHIAWVGDAPRP